MPTSDKPHTAIITVIPQRYTLPAVPTALPIASTVAVPDF